MRELLKSNPQKISLKSLSFLLLLSALGAWFYNVNVTHYSGNNYLPSHTWNIAAFLGLTYGGLRLYFPPLHILRQYHQEILRFFMVMVLIGFATNAVQYTPFSPIDQQIVQFQQHYHLNMVQWMQWTYLHREFRAILIRVYNTLPVQMVYLPLLVILVKRFDRIREYCFLLLISTIIGFMMYYFFPTTAPASILSSAHFFPEQFATGIKFHEIHHHLKPSTLQGGLIALPSFHVIWAWYIVYLLRDWPIACGLLLPFNVLLVFACVLLGWHYPLDIFASIIIILITHALLALHCRGFRKLRIFSFPTFF